MRHKNEGVLSLYIGLAAIEPQNRGNKGAFFPVDDAADFAGGARFVPGEVTVARRQGKRVVFVQNCKNPCCWYWQMPDGSRIYYWERWAYEQAAEINGVVLDETKYGSKIGDPGPCPYCGNGHMTGGHIRPPFIEG